MTQKSSFLTRKSSGQSADCGVSCKRIVMLKKLKSLLFGTAVAASQAAAEGAPPVDVNVAVTNPNLVAAMERLKTDTSSAAKDALLLELNKSNYLVAIFADEMHTSEPDENGQSVIEKNSIIKLDRKSTRRTPVTSA